jgi:hypothetical protein
MLVINSFGLRVPLVRLFVDVWIVWIVCVVHQRFLVGGDVPHEHIPNPPPLAFGCFDLFALDVMFDVDQRPYILEINYR